MRRLAGDAGRAVILGPGGAVDQQRRRHRPRLALSARAACVSWRSPSGAPNSFRPLAWATRLVQRPPGEAERGGADRRAENVERRHRHLEAVARPPEAVARPARGTPSKRRVASGCGAITSMRSATLRPGVSASTTIGREPARARRLAGAGENDVMVGDAAVGDPGLLAVDADMRTARRARGGRHARRRPSPPPSPTGRRRRCARSVAHAGQDSALHRLPSRRC